MSVIERSEEEEPLIKKLKLIDTVENCCEVPMFSQNETVVDVNNGICNKDTCVGLESDNGKIEEVSVFSLVDVNNESYKNDNCVGLELDDSKIEEVYSLSLVDVNNGSCKNDNCVGLELDDRKIEEVSSLSLVDVNNGSCKNENCVGLESDDRNIEEVSSLSLVDGKHIDPKESQDTEIEEKKVDVNSGDRNTEKVPVLELEKNNEASVTSTVTNGDQVSLIVNKDSCDGLERIRELIRANASASGKKLLVLDLNGLLADIVSPLADCKADINIGRRAIFKRPFCEDFLKFCFDKFEVGIWSSRKRNNVLRITEFLLGDMEKKLLFCWDMSYCATTTVGSLENKHKYIVFKDLNRLWEKHDPNLPWQKGYYNATNTVLLDDSPYKALLNPPYTAIFPHSYNHENKTDTSLGNGGDLRLHLEKLVEAENVQDFIKKHPFGQEAITERSESWEIYREAIRMLHLSSQTYRFTNFLR